MAAFITLSQYFQLSEDPESDLYVDLNKFGIGYAKEKYMSFFDDLVDVLKQVVPVIGGIVGGPEGAVIGGISQLLGANDANESHQAALLQHLQSDEGKAQLCDMENVVKAHLTQGLSEHLQELWNDAQAKSAE